MSEIKRSAPLGQPPETNSISALRSRARAQKCFAQSSRICLSARVLRLREPQTPNLKNFLCRHLEADGRNPIRDSKLEGL
jgi:hypothetical protein